MLSIHKQYLLSNESFEQALKKKCLASIDSFNSRDEHESPSFSLPTVMSSKDFNELSVVMREILNIKKKLLIYFLKKYTKQDILSFLGFSYELESYINWDQAIENPFYVVRADILYSQKHKYYFCEFNYGAAIAGMELSSLAKNCLEIFSEEKSYEVINPHHSFIEFFKQSAEEFKADRIILLEWSNDQSDFNINKLIANFKKAIACEVLLKNEKTYFNEPSSFRDLIIPFFPYDHEEECKDYIKKLYCKNRLIFSEFDSLLFSSKAWLGLLWHKDIQCLLSNSEKAVIKKYLPYSELLTNKNQAYFLKHKDNFIFKAVDSYGGREVYIGQQHSYDELMNLFSNSLNFTWLAQSFIEPASIPLKYLPNLEEVNSHCVLGLFLINNEFSGVFVRASANDKVVNFKRGAIATWCLINNTSEV